MDFFQEESLCSDNSSTIIICKDLKQYYDDMSLLLHGFTGSLAVK